MTNVYFDYIVAKCTALAVKELSDRAINDSCPVVW